MADPVFIGNYEGKLKDKNTVNLGKHFSYILNKYRISKIYLSKGEDKEGKILRKKFRYIKVSPEPPLREESIPVEIEEGEIRIPDELVEYAGLKSKEVVIIGMETRPSHLEIWNKNKIDKRTRSPPLDKEMDEVADFFIEEERKKLRVH